MTNIIDWLFEYKEYLYENTFKLLCVATVIWFCMAFAFYIIIKYFFWTRHQSELIRTYITESCVSSMQGFLCGGIGVLGVFNCWHDVMKAEDKEVVFYCTFGAGYFIYDIVTMFYSNYLYQIQLDKNLSLKHLFRTYIRANWIMVCHHIILISILFPALITFSGMGHFFASCFFCMELSSPSVNFRLILSKLNMKHTLLYTINGFAMTILFCIVRILVFPFMYIMYMEQTAGQFGISRYSALCRIPMICHFCCFIILLPQLYWFSLMVRGIYAVLKKKPKLLDKLD